MNVVQNKRTRTRWIPYTHDVFQRVCSRELKTGLVARRQLLGLGICLGRRVDRADGMDDMTSEIGVCQDENRQIKGTSRRTRADHNLS